MATASSIGFSESAILFSICHVSRTHGVKRSNYLQSDRWRQHSGDVHGMLTIDGILRLFRLLARLGIPRGLGCISSLKLNDVSGVFITPPRAAVAQVRHSQARIFGTQCACKALYHRTTYRLLSSHCNISQSQMRCDNFTETWQKLYLLEHPPEQLQEDTMWAEPQFTTSRVPWNHLTRHHWPARDANWFWESHNKWLPVVIATAECAWTSSGVKGDIL